MNRQRKTGLSAKRIAKALNTMLGRHCEMTGDNREIIAEELDISRPYLNQITNAGGDTPCPADLLVRLTILLNDATVIETICQLCGGTFIPTRKAPKAELSDVLRAVGEVSKEVGEAVKKVLDSCNDGIISRDEFDSSVRELTEAAVAIDNLIQSVTAMAKQPHKYLATSIAEAEETAHV